MSPGSKLLIAVLTPNLDQRLLKPEAQYLFTINTETNVVQPVSCSMVPIRCIIPVAGDRFFLANVSNIAECSLVEESDGSYSLERL